MGLLWTDPMKGIRREKKKAMHFLKNAMILGKRKDFIRGVNSVQKESGKGSPGKGEYSMPKRSC